MDLKIYAFADEASPSLAGQIAAMRRNHLNGVEIRGVDGVICSDLSDRTAKEVRAKLEDAGLTVWSMGSPIGKIDVVTGDWPTHLEKYRRTLELAHILGAGNIRAFSFYYPANTDPALYRNEIIDRLSRMAEMAEKEGIALCHENEKAIYGDNADRCADLLTNVRGLKGVFDPANFVQCGQDTLAAWKKLAPWIHYLHIKDALADGRVVPAGKGIGNVRAILEDYRKRGGQEVTIEPHLKVFQGLQALEKDGARSEVGGLVESYPTGDAAFDAACAALRDLA